MTQNRNLKAIAVILCFFIGFYTPSRLQSVLHLQITSYSLQIFIQYFCWLFPPIIYFVFTEKLSQFAQQCGLTGNLKQALIFAFVTVLPMLLSSVIGGSFDTQLHITKAIHYTLLAGFMEELLFRGFLFGQLFRTCRWGFIPASLPGAIFFGLGHLYQAGNPHESFSIFLVTFAGALWFAWLYAEWNNLWVPIFLHIFMNSSWVLFNVGENAAGTLSSNIFRGISIALTISLTLRYKRRHQIPLFINKMNLITNQSDT